MFVVTAGYTGNEMRITSKGTPSRYMGLRHTANEYVVVIFSNLYALEFLPPNTNCGSVIFCCARATAVIAEAEYEGSAIIGNLLVLCYATP